MVINIMHLDDFNYTLPANLIARYPLDDRSASRLLCIQAQAKTLAHRQFKEVIDLVQPGDLFILNDTKVIPARLFGEKKTGGKAEILVERVLSRDRLKAQVRVSKALHEGDFLFFKQGIQFEVINRSPPFYELCYEGERTILEVIEQLGEIPLPPYLHREPDQHDLTRYQTVYAKHKGSVAAPTAGLHVDDALLTALEKKGVNIGYVTLHIGAGTFAPVRVENIAEHQMHAEYLDVSVDLCERIKQTKANGHRVIAVGTTTLRALETAAQSGEVRPFTGETSIFIYPGYEFKSADVLITNLHLPCSTLLMLVAAFGGHGLLMRAYREAVDQSYRFYSYGDAMWIER